MKNNVDHILALKLRACAERSRLRNNPLLDFLILIHQINQVNRKYAALIVEEQRREELRHASPRP